MTNLKKILAGMGTTAIIMACASLAPAALASVSLTIAPETPINSPLILPQNSAPTQLFSFSLNSTSGESMSSVVVEIDKANTATNVSGTHLGSLAVYKDNGDGVFNSSLDSLVGSATHININSPTVIPFNFPTNASGQFFVTLATSGNWTSLSPVDSITATFPSNGITISANPPTYNAVTTSIISAGSPYVAQTTVSQQLSANSAAINQGVYDTASLNNTNGSAGGTVNYNVYLGGLCTGTAVFSDTEPVTFNDPLSSKAFVTTATGGYSWQAWYSGDTNNTSATSSCVTELVGLAAGTTTPPPVSTSGSLPVTGMTPMVLLAILGSGAAFILKKVSFV